MKKDLELFAVYKPKENNDLKYYANYYIITEFAFPIDKEEGMIIVVHGFYGLDKEFSILANYLTEEQFEENFELYKTADKLRKEYRELTE